MRNAKVYALVFGLIFGVRTPVLAHNEIQEPEIKLVLAISIDQMRYDYLVRFAPLYKQGLKKLLQEGAVFSEARYSHANTETGPGHAVILSGRHGSHSGIISNSWYDSFLKKSVNVVDDPLHKPIGGKGRSASPAHFDGFTFPDVLKAKYAESKVVGVAGKDRAAILMAGKIADGAFWFEKSEGKFITSSYYIKKAPEWLNRFNEKQFADKFFGKPWERLHADPKLYEDYAGPDAVLGEWDSKDTTFPHSIRGKRNESSFYEDFLRTPFLDEMTLEFALSAREAYHLGENSKPDIFAIGFSATDYIGHTYGPDSQEVMDQLLRLDLLLGRLFTELESKVGLNKTLIVLTSDHGVLPLVETLKLKGLKARRVKPEEFQKVVDVALEKRFPHQTGFIAFSEAPNFWLDTDKIIAAGVKVEDVEREIVNALMSTGWIESVYSKSDFFKTPPKDDPDFKFLVNSFFASRSPDIISNVKLNILIDYYGGGTSHGTPHDYDRHVPIVFMGPSIKPGTYQQPCGPEDIAPTLASILDIKYPKELDSRVLFEMMLASSIDKTASQKDAHKKK